MRKKKRGKERLDACRELLLENINEPMEDPAAVFSMAGAETWLEIGAGKGGFAIEMAKRNETVAYIAMEKVSDCVTLAAEGAKRAFGQTPKNLRFLIDTADNLTRLFAEETLDRIFLNFSDPWSKKGYAKRRLTHARYLAVYFNLLKDGGKLRFKTDNNGLFDFTLAQIEEMGLSCDVITRDLHASPYNEANVMTEYESNFSSMGMKINMLELTKPCGFKPEIPDELKKDRKEYAGKKL